MLTVEELHARTYEERQADNLQRLPLLSKEWTNYNPSDPGITILENLTAFASLQASDLTSIGYRARMAILKLADFTPSKGKCARVLLSPDDTETKVSIPSGQRFWLGDVCYETIRETQVGGGRLTGAFSCHQDEFRDISHVLDRAVVLTATLFGEKPEKGDSLYIVADEGSELSRDMILYITMDEREDRNPFENRTESFFAGLTWEYFTAAGFVKMEARDFTGAFSRSGEIRLRFGSEPAAVWKHDGVQGYCIRAVLDRAEYDVPPRLKGIDGFLFEVWQKETRAFCQTFQRTDRITAYSPLGEEVYWSVYAREEKGSSYRKYELTLPGGNMRGRFVNYTGEGDGRMSFNFDADSYGYAPSRCKDCVRVVGYSEEIMRRYRVGTVVGYDEQEIELPVKNIVPESFCLLAMRHDEDGSEIYDFVRPEKKTEGALYFHLLENDGRIVIEEAGDFIGAELFMASVANTEGKRGNVRAGNTFKTVNPELSCFNPGDGTGGSFRETLDEVRARFVKDMHTPYAAVTAEDYEKLVMTTSGLCIKKVRAVLDESENLIRIAVMPGTGGDRPKLSEVYMERIEKRLAERRLITTGFKIVQPVYGRVGVRCTVYVKRHYTDCRKMIEERLKERIDYTASARNFGEPLLFEEVFHAIEELPCVEYVYDLSLRPENVRIMQLKEFDILPAENCLCCPGEIILETVSI